MLHSLKDMTGYELSALDGTLGQVREAYFDDHRWVVRHVVVDTGGWLAGRRVLISPHAIQRVDAGTRLLDVALTRKQIELAPPVESDRPVSRQYEIATADFYGYPYYWGGAGLWGAMDMPLAGALGPYTGTARGLAPDAHDSEGMRERLEAEQAAADPHLRSSAEVIGYDVAARDGSIGHVADFLVDPATWQIALVVVDTHNWLPDRLVLVRPSWVDRVDWSSRQAIVRMSREAVKDSPPYDAALPLGVDEAVKVQTHFERS